MKQWIRLGLSFKKWLLRLAFGLFIFSCGILLIIKNASMDYKETTISAILIISGSVWLIFWVRKMLVLLVDIASRTDFKGKKNTVGIKNYLYNLKVLDKGPKIAVIGGGTGISTMLRGLKAYSSNITAIITVADDGGGSGKLRNELGILPPGDIRNCILALADTEPVMERLLQYRFKEGDLKGQSFGNLFLAAMNGVSGSFEQAVKDMSEVLAVKGQVLPVTSECVALCAELEDGHIIVGESQIGNHNETHKGKISRVYLDKNNVSAVEDSLLAIRQADIIVLGPGSLYTSIIPNLLVNTVCDEIKRSKAKKVYVCNVMTQPGETDDYSAFLHIDAIEKHSYQGVADYCIVNTGRFPKEILAKYKHEGAVPVRVDYSKFKKRGIRLITGDFFKLDRGYIRHDPDKLAMAVMEIVSGRYKV